MDNQEEEAAVLEIMYRSITHSLSAAERKAVDEAMEEFQAELNRLIEQGVEDMIAHDAKVGSEK